ncbi:MAG: hypothetical protein O7D91_17500 [Planctomycetota bacterium]|nr:hypothetical protein [Planctomycetota bacterium]
MPQNVWTPTTGNYDTTANWLLARKPEAADDVVIPAETTIAIDSNADGEDAIDLASIQIQRGHTPDIATSGVPWAISTAKLVHQGGGTLFFSAGSATLPAVNECIIDATPIAADRLSASLTGTAAAADWGDITVVRGWVDIEAVTFTIARLIVGAMGAQASTAKVNVKSVNGLITLMIVNSGEVLLNRPVTTLIVNGGRVVIDDFKPVTVHQYGGVVEYKTPTTVGDITEYNLGGGTLDLTASFEPKGITTLNRWGRPESQSLLEDQNVTITNRNDYRIPG